MLLCFLVSKKYVTLSRILCFPSLARAWQGVQDKTQLFKQQFFNSTIMAYVIGDDCIACGTCIDECPSGAISEGEKYSIDPNVCVDCGTCADVCPSGAIAPGE